MLTRVFHKSNQTKQNCPLCKAGVPLRVLMPISDLETHETMLLDINESTYNSLIGTMTDVLEKQIENATKQASKWRSTTDDFRERSNAALSANDLRLANHYDRQFNRCRILRDQWESTLYQLIHFQLRVERDPKGFFKVVNASGVNHG